MFLLYVSIREIYTSVTPYSGYLHRVSHLFLSRPWNFYRGTWALICTLFFLCLYSMFEFLQKVGLAFPNNALLLNMTTQGNLFTCFYSTFLIRGVYTSVIPYFALICKEFFLCLYSKVWVFAKVLGYRSLELGHDSGPNKNFGTGSLTGTQAVDPQDQVGSCFPDKPPLPCLNCNKARKKWRPSLNMSLIFWLIYNKMRAYLAMFHPMVHSEYKIK